MFWATTIAGASSRNTPVAAVFRTGRVRWNGVCCWEESLVAPSSRNTSKTRMIRKRRRASRGGARFQHLSETEAGLAGRNPISSSFGKHGELLGEETDFDQVSFQKSGRASRGGGRFRNVSESRSERGGEGVDFGVLVEDL
jgi:hypothetical protein